MTHKYKPTLLQDVCRWLYSALLAILIPFSLLTLVYKAITRSHQYNRRRFERYGFIPRAPRSGGVLLHCVSVGEVVAASTLVKAMLAKEPDLMVTITTTTPTGSERVRQIFGESVHHCYLPFDLHMAMAGLLKRIKPSKVLITEVELWPNLIHACWKRNVPVYVVNARMTDKSTRAYQKIAWLFEPMLLKLTHVCAQGQRDYDNYLKLGLPEPKLTLTNNIKFDSPLSEQEMEKAEYLANRYGWHGRPVWVAGSTHQPEEDAVLNAHAELLKTRPDLLLVIVPRHPQRFDKVWELCQKSGLTSVRASEGHQLVPQSQVLLLDEMGVLKPCFGTALFAFVGGSLADRGGHNALEPAAFSVPMLMGPHIYNNPVICQTLQNAGALNVIDSAEQITEKARYWLEHNAAREVAGQAGAKVLAENSGAIRRTLDVLGM